MTQLNLDLTESRRRRDAGIKQVKSHNSEWCEAALIYLENRQHVFKADYPGDVLGEDVRRMLVPLIGKPTHVNAWGALIRIAVEKGYLLDTGRYTKARSVKAHARTVKVYRWGNCQG
jgi:hypothetical protein